MPAYNVQATIAGVVRGALRYVPEVLVADDGSTDATAAEAAAAGAEVVSIGKNRGKGHALTTLFQVAASRGYRAVISMDADGQHDPCELPRFLEAHTRQPGSVIVGSRMHAREKIPRARYNSMHVARFFISLASNQFIEDTQCGYRVYPLAAIRRLELTQGRYVTESEILIKVGDLGGRVTTIPIGTIYGDHVSHFRPILDVTFITAYIISYLMVKYFCEAIAARRPHTYHRGNLRDRIARVPTLDYGFKTACACTIIPAMFVYLLLYTLGGRRRSGNYASVRALGKGFYGLTLATAMLPVILAIISTEKLLQAMGFRRQLVDAFIQTFYPDLWSSSAGPQQGPAPTL